MEELQRQLVISRNELKNLRQQLLSLTVQHRKDVDTIKSLLVNVTSSPEQLPSTVKKDDETARLSAIGVIRSVFGDKRAVPRQSVLANEIQGCVEISPSCFNNPEHSLEGLEEFSHMWIIYQFHRNESHTKAKVAPPRLNGERVGVFSTRSPHRPCPIGLSLVRIDRIEGNRVFFYGTDMVDETPVYDLKPYIPKYDCPMVEMMSTDTGEWDGWRDRLSFNNSFSPFSHSQLFNAPLVCPRGSRWSGDGPRRSWAVVIKHRGDTTTVNGQCKRAQLDHRWTHVKGPLQRPGHLPDRRTGHQSEGGCGAAGDGPSQCLLADETRVTDIHVPAERGHGDMQIRRHQLQCDCRAGPSVAGEGGTEVKEEC